MTGISSAVITEQLQAANTEAARIADSFKVDEKGRFDISREQYGDYQTAVGKAKELKSVLDGMSTVADIEAYLNEPTSTPAAAGGFAGGQEFKSLGDMAAASDGFKRVSTDEGLAQWQGNRIAAQMEGKSIFNLSGGTATVQALGSAQQLGIAEQARRKWHVRDLFPKSSTKASVLYGVRETGWTNRADFVEQRDANGWVKAPKTEIDLESVLYPVAEVAHTITAHKNILNDEPRLKTFLNTRMVEGVKYAEDRELLFGAGGAQKVTGIANTPGVQNYTGLAEDKYSVQIRRAITKSLLAEYDPTGLVISPEMWEHVEVEEDDHGAFRVAVAVAIGAEKRVWRLNVVETTAMTDTDFLIGAFGMGAQLHDREAVSVSVSSENATNFEEGLITVRADERLALEVPRPESFVLGKWTEPGSAPVGG